MNSRDIKTTLGAGTSRIALASARSQLSYEQKVAAGIAEAKIFLDPIGDELAISEFYLEPLVMGIINAIERKPWR